MNQRIIIVVLLFLSASCQRTTNPSRFGFARLSFSAYYWTAFPGVPKAESFSFRIHPYEAHGAVVFQKFVQVDSAGACSGAIAHRLDIEPSYFRSTLPSLADTVLRHIEAWRLDSIYSPQVGRVELYDGPSYCIILERKDGSSVLVTYNPRDIPGPLLHVHELLYSTVDSISAEPHPSFDLSQIADLIGRRDGPRFKAIPTVVTPTPTSDGQANTRSKTGH